MAATNPATILLKGDITQNEGTAGGAITPGHLVQMNAAGAIVVHAEAGGAAPERAFALEDDAQGRGIGDAYDATTHKNVRYGICPPGTEIYAILADSNTIAINDPLVSNGDGTLAEGTVTSPATTNTQAVVARALEAVTTSGSTSRIKVRVV